MTRCRSLSSGLTVAALAVFCLLRAAPESNAQAPPDRKQGNAKANAPTKARSSKERATALIGTWRMIEYRSTRTGDYIKVPDAYEKIKIVTPTAIINNPANIC